MFGVFVTSAPDPFDELLDPRFIASAPKEAAGEDRIEKAKRITASHQQLQKAGEIADGTGKPQYRFKKRSYIIGAAVVIAVVIVVIAVVVSR